MEEKNKNIPKRRFKEFENAPAWEQRELGELSEIVRGASPRPIQDSKWFNKKSDIGWLRISDVTEQNGRIYYLRQRISELGQERTRVLKTPHLLLSIAATVGKPVINYVSTGVHDGFLIFLKPNFEVVFMFQYLEMFRPNWQKYGQPGSQVNLNSEIVRNHKILVPKQEEQKKIGEYFNQLDQIITLHQRKLDKLKETKVAYLSEIFPAEGERKPKRRFEGFIDDWEQRKLNEIANMNARIGWQNLRRDEFLDTGDYYLITGTDFKNGFVDLKTCHYIDKFRFNQDTKIQVSEESILITKDGTLGKVAMVQNLDKPAALNAGVFNVTKKIEIIDTNYLFEFLKAPFLMEYVSKRATGGTIKHLNQNILVDFPVKFPSLDEQILIGMLFRQIDQTITLHQNKINKLKKLKEAYLSEMFV